MLFRIIPQLLDTDALLTKSSWEQAAKEHRLQSSVSDVDEFFDSKESP